MNQVVSVAYMPGAFGSFLCWAIERTSLIRSRHLPAVTDDPLLPDGSSHAYASFCKVKTSDGFIDGLDEARKNPVPWGHAVYAGWPCGEGESLQDSVDRVRSHMGSADRMIVVVPENAVDHYIAYVRNEHTLDRDRWFAILGIKEPNQLYDRMVKDIQADYTLETDDPRILKISISNILYDPPSLLFNKIAKLVGWPTSDFALFENTLSEMRRRQLKYLQMIMNVSRESSLTANAIIKYRLEHNNGFN